RRILARCGGFPMARWPGSLLGALILVFGHSASWAWGQGFRCCRVMATLRAEAKDADIILYGTLKNARQTDAKGNGTVELHVHEVLKGHPITAGKKVVILDQYVHLANINGPPRFTVFCSVHENKIETYRSIHVTAQGIVNYVQGALALDPKDHAKALA